MKKRGIIISASIVIFVTLAVILVRYIDRGGFEKELIPDFRETQNSWKNVSGPFVKTQWKQDGAYASFVPGNDLLGCWSVAFAQVLAHHHRQPSGVVEYTTEGGKIIKMEFNDPVNWDKIVNSVESDTPVENSRVTATYCLAVAVVVQKDFGTGDYKDVSIIPGEVGEHFSCTVNKTDTDISGMIASELMAERPVVAYFNDILGIKIVRNGHAAVIDGYAEQDGEPLVHINLGWGGKEDGWFKYNTIAKERKLYYIFSVTPK